MGIGREQPCAMMTEHCEARHGRQKLAVMIVSKVNPVRAGL